MTGGAQVRYLSSTRQSKPGGLLESPNNVLARPSRVRANAVALRNGWFPVGQGQKGLRVDATQPRLERHHSAAVGPVLLPPSPHHCAIHPDGSAEAAVLQLTHAANKAHLPTVQLSHRQHKAVLVLPECPKRRPRVKFPSLAPARLEVRRHIPVLDYNHYPYVYTHPYIAYIPERHFLSDILAHHPLRPQRNNDSFLATILESSTQIP
ncbi:hypothetical protein BM1_02436 [Bipolaris maydis]|nr:hypothetical protein BM1_02436 [Bipolaris maydis]